MTTTSTSTSDEHLLKLLWETIEANTNGFYSATSANPGLQNENIILTTSTEPKKQVVLRKYPNPKDVTESLHSNEVAVLLWLQECGFRKAPKLLYHDFSKKACDRPFAVLEFVHGTPLAPTEIRNFLPQVIQSLKEVHGIPLPSSLAQTIDDKLLLDLSVERTWLETAQSLEKNTLSISTKMTSHWEKIQATKNRHGSFFAQAVRNVLVHGDAHCGNVLYNKENNLLAWIDWEACHIGNPLEDLANFSVVSFPPLSKLENNTILQEYFTKEPNEEDKTLFLLFKFRKLCRVISVIGPKIVGAGEQPSLQLVSGMDFFLSLLDSILTELE